MEKFSDLFKELRDRVSNPFFLSFAISWIFINWKIIVGLVLYDMNELQIDGYKSYIHLVSENSISQTLLFQPLLVALSYTFLFPFVRNCIYAFNSWIKTWGDAWNLNLSRQGKISIDKYISLRETYESRTKMLEEVINKESNFLKENEELRNSVFELKNEINSASEELSSWRSRNDPGLISGTWEFSYTAFTEDRMNSSKLTIHNYSIIQEDSMGSSISTPKEIKYIHSNPKSNQIILTIAYDEITKQGTVKVYKFYQLEIFNDGKLLRGKENEQYLVEFKKVY